MYGRCEWRAYVVGEKGGDWVHGLPHESIYLWRADRLRERRLQEYTQHSERSIVSPYPLSLTLPRQQHSTATEQISPSGPPSSRGSQFRPNPTLRTCLSTQVANGSRITWQSPTFSAPPLVTWQRQTAKGSHCKGKTSTATVFRSFDHPSTHPVREVASWLISRLVNDDREQGSCVRTQETDTFVCGGDGGDREEGRQGRRLDIREKAVRKQTAPTLRFGATEIKGQPNDGMCVVGGICCCSGTGKTGRE
ncbi:hypothetical protein IWX49DRAFT_629672 [Phyllosticta citricarpa]